MLTGKFTDVRDGKVYKTVFMPDGQWWAAENLAWAGAGVDYANNSANRAIYGRLYTQVESLASVPAGTHVPTTNEWNALATRCTNNASFRTANLGLRLKSKTGWLSNNGLDEYGFNALPGGRRSSATVFENLGELASFWCNTGTGTATWREIFSPTYGDGGQLYSGGGAAATVCYAVRFVVDKGNVPDFYYKTGTFKDPRDNKVYKTVLMPDGKWWAAENLAWTGSGADYADTPSNRTTYGRLYTWVEAGSACPAGTHLPTNDEWTTLERKIDIGNTNLSELLRARSTLWTGGSSSDAFGFAALPAGFYSTYYVHLGVSANFWTASEAGTSLATTHGKLKFLYYTQLYLQTQESLKTYRASVRFIVDSGNVPDGTAEPLTGKYKDSRDGKIYKTVRMPDGNWWFAENLAFPLAGAKYPANNIAEVGVFGYLYSQSQASSALPTGCRLPSEAEVDVFRAACGLDGAGGALLRQDSTPDDGITTNAYWATGSKCLSAYGFDMRAAGFFYQGNYASAKQFAFVLTSTSYGGTDGLLYCRYLNVGTNGIGMDETTASQHACSIRCIVESGNVPDWPPPPALEAPFPSVSPAFPAARSLLLEQYHEKSRIEGIVEQLAEEADKLDTARQELWSILYIDAAEGAQLDGLGILANEPRKGRSDAEYRTVLKLFFATQVSGTPKDVARSVAEYTGAASVQVVPEYPAAYFVLADTSEDLSILLDRISVAGVRGMHGTRLALSTGGLLKTHANSSVAVPVAGATGKFTDARDGKIYKTVLMPDGKWWSAENLAWPGSGWDYNNDPANRAVYGRLYTWDEANSSCPSGTHLPTDAEWTAMETACGTPATLGIRLRANSVLWTNPAARGTDNYGFGILPAGRRTWASTFSQLGSFANLWSATVASSGRSWDRETWDGTSTVTRYSEEQIVGESVRFIVDSGNVPDSPAWTLGSNSADILVVNE